MIAPIRPAALATQPATSHETRGTLANPSTFGKPTFGFAADQPATSQEGGGGAGRLKYYPDYIDDPDGLERFRQAVRSSRGHDMADVNYNSLGRLIDTIERLRRERDALAATPTPPTLSEDLLRQAASLVYRIEASGPIDDERTNIERWKADARALAPELRAALAQVKAS